MKRRGLFGGTFDPLHNGHLSCAERVAESFNLERIVLIPAARPPHKRNEGFLPARCRLEMLKLAVKEHPLFEVSDFEIKKGGESYTIETLTHFKSKELRDTSFFFIIGMDAFLELDTWMEPERVLEAMPFIIMPRPGDSGSLSMHVEARLNRYLKSVFSQEYRISNEKDCIGTPCFLFADIPLSPISSTEIRKRIRENRTVSGLLPEIVENHIKSKGFYK